MTNRITGKREFDCSWIPRFLPYPFFQILYTHLTPHTSCGLEICSEICTLLTIQVLVSAGTGHQVFSVFVHLNVVPVTLRC